MYVIAMSLYQIIVCVCVCVCVGVGVGVGVCVCVGVGVCGCVWVGGCGCKTDLVAAILVIDAFQNGDRNCTTFGAFTRSQQRCLD